jgi:hypothetical protein
MSWYILYPKSWATSKKRVALRKTKPLKPVSGYGFAEGPLATLADVSHRLNAMNVPASKRPMRNGRLI